jgi:hypothetical protein
MDASQCLDEKLSTEMVIHYLRVTDVVAAISLQVIDTIALPRELSANQLDAKRISCCAFASIRGRIR